MHTRASSPSPDTIRLKHFIYDYVLAGPNPARERALLEQMKVFLGKLAIPQKIVAFAPGQCSLFADALNMPFSPADDRPLVFTSNEAKAQKAWALFTTLANYCDDKKLDYSPALTAINPSGYSLLHQVALTGQKELFDKFFARLRNLHNIGRIPADRYIELFTHPTKDNISFIADVAALGGKPLCDVIIAELRPLCESGKMSKASFDTLTVAAQEGVAEDARQRSAAQDRARIPEQLHIALGKGRENFAAALQMLDRRLQQGEIGQDEYASAFVTPTEDRFTLLQTAARNNDENLYFTIKAKLQELRGAKMISRQQHVEQFTLATRQNFTLLHSAVKGENMTLYKDIVQTLKEFREKNDLSVRELAFQFIAIAEGSFTLLHTACKDNSLEMYNAVTADLKALYEARQIGKEEYARQFTAHSAGYTLIHTAIKNKNPALYDRICEDLASLRDSGIITPQEYSDQFTHPCMGNYTALQTAVHWGNVPLYEKLTAELKSLCASGSINETTYQRQFTLPDSEGFTPLLSIISTGDHPFFEHFLTDLEEALTIGGQLDKAEYQKQLLQTTQRGWNILHCATKPGVRNPFVITAIHKAFERAFGDETEATLETLKEANRRSDHPEWLQQLLDPNVTVESSGRKRA